MAILYALTAVLMCALLVASICSYKVNICFHLAANTLFVYNMSMLVLGLLSTACLSAKECPKNAINKITLILMCVCNAKIDIT